MRRIRRFLGRSRLRWLLAVIVSVIAVLFCLVTASLVILFNYPTFGRITSFQEIKAGIALPGTNYIIEQTDSSFQLKNSLSQNTATLIYKYNPYAPPPAYTLLSHRDNLYLITMVENGGSMGGYVFDIFNITGDQPHNLMLDNPDMNSGYSCAYPRLDGDELEFEIEGHCDFFPIPTEPITAYSVLLR